MIAAADGSASDAGEIRFDVVATRAAAAHSKLTAGQIARANRCNEEKIKSVREIAVERADHAAIFQNRAAPSHFVPCKITPKQYNSSAIQS